MSASFINYGFDWDCSTLAIDGYEFCDYMKTRTNAEPWVIDRFSEAVISEIETLYHDMESAKCDCEEYKARAEENLEKAERLESQVNKLREELLEHISESEVETILILA